MDEQLVFVVLLGIISSSHQWISGSVLEVTVRQGANITLYCDCKYSTGEYIVWFRNCSHENQPTLVLRQTPRDIISSYDLLILNFTDTDEGFYYCGTEKLTVEEGLKHIGQQYVYTYGSITSLLFKSSQTLDPPAQDGALCWTLLFSLCPAFALLSSLLSSLLVYHLCRKKGKDPQIEAKGPDTRGQTRKNQDEDVHYAVLEIRQASQRPKRKKKTHTSNFSTYAAINTSRV
ncbi:uncharacterized protein LOC115428914 isoform X2 [Sphaeramia orbicularis]|uniref:uncharacterized protein LOC115428914 isoform X2 n=1 Tax=Sphaeramia orbicularis TaxID=375764 RepID=UPI00117CCB9A|nr:uncharacterized protein LOC115428914 isoform X2 [Sphaeramia orbicularis]